MRRGDRRSQREELESTWNVYDATRPIRREDFVVAPAANAPATAEEVAKVAEATDAQLAKLFGVTEMDVRESRKWAREQAALTEGATVTTEDTGTRH